MESTSNRWNSAAGDRDLVERAKSRDSAAWTEIYERHQPIIYRYVKARLFDEDAAEDVTSAIFVAAVSGIDAYRHRGKPLLAWLYGIARNAVADYQRRSARERKRRWLPPRGVDRAGEPRRSDSSEVAYGEQGNAVAFGIDRTDIEDAMTRLGDTQREVVILRYFVGLTTAEIAATLGKKPSAVYSLEARALLALRRQLTG